MTDIAVAIYLYLFYLFYPFINALIGEALLHFVVYSMYDDNKGFLTVVLITDLKQIVNRRSQMSSGKILF